AFQGSSKLSTLSAILREEPKPASSITPNIPREVERILTRCLRKDPDRRFQTMADLKVALEELKEEADSGTLTAGPRAEAASGGKRLTLAIAVAALLLLAGAGGAWWLLRSRQAAAPTVTRLTSDLGLTVGGSISRDGKLMVYSSDRSGEGNF